LRICGGRPGGCHARPSAGPSKQERRVPLGPPGVRRRRALLTPVGSNSSKGCALALEKPATRTGKLLGPPDPRSPFFDDRQDKRTLPPGFRPRRPSCFSRAEIAPRPRAPEGPGPPTTKPTSVFPSVSAPRNPALPRSRPPSFGNSRGTTNNRNLSKKREWRPLGPLNE